MQAFLDEIERKQSKSPTIVDRHKVLIASELIRVWSSSLAKFGFSSDEAGFHEMFTAVGYGLLLGSLGIPNLQFSKVWFGIIWTFALYELVCWENLGLKSPIIGEIHKGVLGEGGGGQKTMGSGRY